MPLSVGWWLDEWKLPSLCVSHTNTLADSTLMNDRLGIIQFFSAESFQLSMRPAGCRSESIKFDRLRGRSCFLGPTETLILIERPRIHSANNLIERSRLVKLRFIFTVYPRLALSVRKDQFTHRSRIRGIIPR
jgi:hypothetical protein